MADVTDISFLDANMVYMFVAAMSFILFEWIKQVFFNKGVIDSTAMRCN